MLGCMHARFLRAGAFNYQIREIKVSMELNDFFPHFLAGFRQKSWKKGHHNILIRLQFKDYETYWS